jgi:hypothetical protein
MDQGTTWPLGCGKAECRLQQETFGSRVCCRLQQRTVVPYNQSVHALDLVTRFLQNKSFADHALPSYDFGYPATDKACWQKVPPAGEEHHLSLLVLAVLCSFAVGFAVSTHYWRNRLYERVSSVPVLPMHAIVISSYM